MTDPSAEAANTHQITIGNANTSIACRTDQTVLQAAIVAGIDYPYACASGNCGICISRLESGEVSLLPHNDVALSGRQVLAGLTLACRARPQSDVAIAWLGRPGGGRTREPARQSPR